MEGCIETKLVGEYRHSLDEKGRFLIPAKLRDDLGQLFYVAKGLDGCLILYPEDEYFKKVEGYRSLGVDFRNTFRDFMKNSAEIVPDKQFRALIPQKLRDFAGFKDNVVLVGLGSTVEVWDAAVYDGVEDVPQQDYIDADKELEKRRARE